MWETNLSCQTALTDEKSFYPAFLDDLRSAQHEVIVESPYITSRRMKTLRKEPSILLGRGVASL